MGTVSHLLAAAITLATTAAASAQFWSVGVPSGGRGSGVNDLSSNGLVSVGYTATGSLTTAFAWSATQGRNDFGYESGFPNNSSAMGVSGDGLVSVGLAFTRVSGQNDTLPLAYRWAGPGTYQSLGDPGRNTGSTAVDANRDGSVIVGNLSGTRGGSVRPFRWTAAGGLQSLGFAGGDDTEAFAISDDGNKIIGSVSAAGRGFVWTVDRGYEFVSGLPGGDGISFLYGMNRAGTIYVGNANIEATGAMWINGTVINLGKLVDDFGTVVAGYSIASGPLIATVWTQPRGIEPLSDYLASQGVTIPLGVMLRSCESVSADGLTFAGSASLDGVPNSSFGYVVTIPCPAGAVVVLGSFLTSVFRQRRRVMN